jgi:putative hydrolase of the HAD superfamily
MIHVLDMMPVPDYASLNAAFARALGVPDDLVHELAPLLSAAYLTDQWVAAEGAAAAVGTLIAKGYLLAVVSNTSHGRMSPLLRRSGILDQIEDAQVPVFDSGVVGVRKPDARIFAMALDCHRVRPEDSMHIGDSLIDDVAGAREAGLSAVHIDPLSLCSARDHPHAASLADAVTDVVGA